MLMKKKYISGYRLQRVDVCDNLTQVKATMSMNPLPKKTKNNIVFGNTKYESEKGCQIRWGSRSEWG